MLNRTSTAAFIFTAFALSICATSQTFDSHDGHEDADIAKIAEITRADHSTIFFCGLTRQGYTRDGRTTLWKFEHSQRYSYCSHVAVSRDGSMLAYSSISESQQSLCRVTLKDVSSGSESTLAEIDAGSSGLSWSWDGKELSYIGRKGVYAISLKSKVQRQLFEFPFSVDGKIPTEGWSLRKIEPLHYSPDYVLDAEICIPTQEPGTCNQTDEMLLFSGNAIHFSAYGRGAAVSPIENQVAYIASKGLTLAKPDGSYPKTVSNLPAFLGLFKEEPWDGPVWSPRGERVWFSTIIDEGGNMNLYLLDVRNRKKRRIVRHSQMRIIAWR